MERIEIITRRRLSDYSKNIEVSINEKKFALECAGNAVAVCIPFLESVAHRHPKLKTSEMTDTLKGEIKEISIRFWKDFDFDHRATGAEIKHETAKLIKPLQSLINTLGQQTPISREALGCEYDLLRPDGLDKGAEMLAKLEELSIEFLKITSDMAKKKYVKAAKGKRFDNACEDLALLWEALTAKRFPKTSRAEKAQASRSTRRKQRAFPGDPAQFVFIALCEIGYGWVTVGQVEGGLKALQGGKN